MNEAELKGIRDWFELYADRYCRENGCRESVRAMMVLKREHSRRVSQEAATLASDLGWNRSDQITSEALGLLHDAGRFSQMAEFGTFRDVESVNHALRGVQVVQESKVLDRCRGGRREQILDGIRLHNGLRVPAGLSAGSVPFLHLIRDADKLDIFEIFLDAFRNNRIHDYPEIAHHVDLEGPVSPELAAEVRAGRIPSYRMIRSLCDWKLLQVSWVFDLHYRPSCRRVGERRVLERLRDSLPDTAEIAGTFEGARAHLEMRCRTG